MIGSRIGSRIGSGVGSVIGQRRGVHFIAAVGATFAVPIDFVLVTIATPSGIRPGDTMLFVVTTQDGGLAVAPPTGFTQVASLSTASAVCGIYRRIATGSELTSYSSQLTDGASHATGALLVYRGLDTEAAIVGASMADVVLSNAFGCPSLTLDASTDLFIGIASVFADLIMFTPPLHGVERLDEPQTSEEAQQLAVFDIQPGVGGPTGIITTTADTEFVLNGVAISLALKAA